MGGEREDTDSRPKGAGNEAGLGARPPGSGRVSGASPGIPEGHAPAVDFDALHAALGDQAGQGESEALLGGLDDAPTGKVPRASESSGRSSATYASERPRTIPPTRPPTEDLNAPPVIVASEDTVPSAPPQMTVPLAQPLGALPHGGVAFAPGPHAPAGPPSSRPQGNGARPPSHPFTPPAFAAQRGPQMTMRMPDRPVSPRRSRTPTIVVRNRGPSAKQKLVAFMAMLLLVTACGIAVIIWRKPRWIGLDPALPLAAPTSVPAAYRAPAVATPLTAVPVAPLAPTVISGAVTSPLPAPSAVPSAAATHAPKPKPKAAVAPTHAPSTTATTARPVQEGF